MNEIVFTISIHEITALLFNALMLLGLATFMAFAKQLEVIMRGLPGKIGGRWSHPAKVVSLSTVVMRMYT